MKLLWGHYKFLGNFENITHHPPTQPQPHSPFFYECSLTDYELEKNNFQAINMMQKAFLRTYIGNIYALPEQVAVLVVFTGGMAGLALIFGGMAGLGPIFWRDGGIGYPPWGTPFNDDQLF